MRQSLGLGSDEVAGKEGRTQPWECSFPPSTYCEGTGGFLCVWGRARLSCLGFSVGQDNFGYDLAAVEAAKKKHEAIETDTAAYKERVQALEDLAQELEKENYHDQKRITARKDNILRLWSYLQELLAARRQRLETTLALQKLFQDMLHSIDWMDEIKVGLSPTSSTPLGPQWPPCS